MNNVKLNTYHEFSCPQHSFLFLNAALPHATSTAAVLTLYVQ